MVGYRLQARAVSSQLDANRASERRPAPQLAPRGCRLHWYVELSEFARYLPNVLPRFAEQGDITMRIRA